MQALYLAGILALAGSGTLDVSGVGAVLLLSLLIAAVDQIGNMGGGQALVLDTVARAVRPAYRCASYTYAYTYPHQWTTRH